MLQVGLEILGNQRGANQVALSLIATDLSQILYLLRCFHPHCVDLHLVRMRPKHTVLDKTIFWLQRIELAQYPVSQFETPCTHSFVSYLVVFLG